MSVLTETPLESLHRFEKVYRPSMVAYTPADPISKGQKVLIVLIGQNPMEGVAESIVIASQNYQEKMKAPCDIFVMQSLTVLPPLGLGEMRNFAIMKAYLENYSHLMIIDNDILLDDPLTIVKLVSDGEGFVIPWFEQVYRAEAGSSEMIHWPMFAPNQGLKELAWTVPYCIFYDMQIFRSGQVDVRCHTPTMVYNEDEINSVYLRCHNITLWQDTDVKVKLLRGPRMLWDTLEGGQLHIAKPFEKPQ